MRILIMHRLSSSNTPTIRFEIANPKNFPKTVKGEPKNYGMALSAQGTGFSLPEVPLLFPR
jgi:hypothetical protein